MSEDRFTIHDERLGYFSLKVAADYGSPGNGWSEKASEAVQFAREQDARLFKNTYLQKFSGTTIKVLKAVAL